MPTSNLDEIFNIIHTVTDSLEDIAEPEEGFVEVEESYLIELLTAKRERDTYRAGYNSMDRLCQAQEITEEYLLKRVDELEKQVEGLSARKARDEGYIADAEIGAAVRKLPAGSGIYRTIMGVWTTVGEAGSFVGSLGEAIKRATEASRVPA